jgi:hypothetical protein
VECSVDRATSVGGDIPTIAKYCSQRKEAGEACPCLCFLVLKDSLSSFLPGLEGRVLDAFPLRVLKKLSRLHYRTSRQHATCSPQFPLSGLMTATWEGGSTCFGKFL